MMQMFRKGLVWFGLGTGVVAFLWSPAGATMAPIFGPKQFTRSTGAPQEFTETFQNCETRAQYKLVVVNGGPDGSNRVSSASITLNGTEIVGPRDFNQQVARIERPISVVASNGLQVRLASRPGSFLTVSVECTGNCLDVQITSPIPNSVINRSKTLVVGRVTSTADEVGVTANGVVAQAQEGQFAAPSVPLALGPNSLTVTATNSCRNKAAFSISVTVAQFDDPPVFLSVLPSGGIAPLTVALRAEAAIQRPVASFAWDFTGSGNLEISGPTLSQVQHTYDQAGLFLPRVVVTDAQGRQFSQTSVVSVFSLPRIDTLLKGKWRNLKAALANGDIEGALSLFHTAASGKYARVFNDLKGDLPRIISSLGDLTLVSLRGGVAEYATTRHQEGQDFAYFLYFLPDEEGLWKIVSM